MSTTQVETWSGANLAEIGPIYPFVGTEFMLVVAGLTFWLLFHLIQAGIEARELKEDEALARSPERLARVFEDEAKERL